MQVGAATRPLDVSTTGSAPGHVAQSTLATVGKAITGFGLGVWRFYKPDPVAYFKALTGITLWENGVKGWRDDGALGAVAGVVNTINPLYHWGVGVINAEQKASAGDTEGAVEDGTGVVLGVATTILGGAIGGEAGAAERGVPAAEAATPGAYSVALEVQLALNELGLSRGRHFQIGNEALRSARATKPSTCRARPRPWCVAASTFGLGMAACNDRAGCWSSRDSSACAEDPTHCWITVLAFVSPAARWRGWLYGMGDSCGRSAELKENHV